MRNAQSLGQSRSRLDGARRRGWPAAALFLALALVGAGCRTVSTPSTAVASAAPYALVLGVAQDGGWPQIGCERSCCRVEGTRLRAGQPVSSLLVCDPEVGQRFLFDATPDLPRQIELMRGHPATREVSGPRPPLLDGILLTHAHMGHYTGLLHLGPEAYGAQGVPLFVTERMGEYLRTNGPWSLLVENGTLTLHTLQSGSEIQLSPNVHVTPFAVPHRDEFSDTVGFWIRGPQRSLVFLPDIDKWERWDTPIEDWIARCDVALLDGTFFGPDEVPGRDLAEIPHPFIVESLRRFRSLPAAERNKVRFIHINHSNPALDPESAERAQIEAAGMHVAQTGDRIPLTANP